MTIYYIKHEYISQGGFKAKEAQDDQSICRKLNQPKHATDFGCLAVQFLSLMEAQFGFTTNGDSEIATAL